MLTLLCLALSLVSLALTVSCMKYRQYWRNPQKKLNSPPWAPMALTVGLFFLALAFIPMGWMTIVIFWGIWLIVFTLLWIIPAGWKTLAVIATVGCMAALALGGTFLLTQASPPKAQTVVQGENGKKLPLKDNERDTTPAKPVAGKATTNTTDTRPSLDDGKGPVKSWNDLVQRINAMPEAKRKVYIDAINKRSEHIGTWDDVQKYAKAEKKVLDTRVILVLNSTVSDREARDAVRKDLGKAADTRPIVRLNGVALVNTRGVDTGSIADFADGRSQVRVLLTVPVKKNGKYVANIKAAKNGKGVLTECKNPSTGLVHNPKPVPAAPGKPDSPQSPKTTPKTPTAPPTTSTSTPTPSETPPTTTPPTTTPPTTTPPTTTPPTTRPPETCPPGEVGTPPDCLTPKTPGPEKTDEDNEGKPSTSTPPGDPKSTPNMPDKPANPGDKPGDSNGDVDAPGATQGPTTTPTNQQPNTGGHDTPVPGDVDPEGGQTAAPKAASVGFGFLALVLVEVSRRRFGFSRRS